MDVPKLSANIFPVAIAIVLTLVFSKMLTLLPERFYFTFSEIIESGSDIHLLAKPELPSPYAYCRAQQAAGLIGKELEEKDKELENVCSKILEAFGNKYLVYPSSLVFESEPLTSRDYRDAVLEFIEVVKSNSSNLMRAVESAGFKVERNPASLTGRQIEDFFVKQNRVSLNGLLEYITKNSEIDEYKIDNNMVPMIINALKRVDNVFYDDVDNFRDQAWVALSNNYQNTLLTTELKRIQQRIFGRDSMVFWPSVLLKILPALATGFLIAFVFHKDWLFEISFGSGLAAFLLFWPIILLWDVVVSKYWIDRKWLFFMMYFFYMVSYYYSSRLGAILGLKTREAKLPPEILSQIEWNKIIATVITVILTSSATIIITSSFAFAK
jgi:hypothetical protein